MKTCFAPIACAVIRQPSISRCGTREHDLAVLEGARLGLVGVDDEIVGLPSVLRQEARLAAHREARAAAAAQVRGRAAPRSTCARLQLRAPSRARVAAGRAVLGELGQVARRRRPRGRALRSVATAELLHDRRRRPRAGPARGSGGRPRRRSPSRSRPAHSTVRSVTSPSRVVSPGAMPSSRSNASSTCCAPTSAQETFVQTSTRCCPTGSRWNMS